MPATGELKLNPGRADTPDEGYRSRFSHETEVARPGYYEVELTDYGIKAQLTATQRVGYINILFRTVPTDALFLTWYTVSIIMTGKRCGLIYA